MAWSDASFNWYSASSDYSDVLTNDWRQCQLEGCRKKHAFARGIRGNKVYSKYCAEHTCAKPYTEAQGFHCSTPRKAGERYCPDHLRCNEPGCGRQGEFVGVHDYVPWVCVSHRCTAPDCRSRATDLNQQRCAAHLNRCTVAGCAKPCYLHRDGRLDLVCAVHYGTVRCLWDGCARRTGSSMRYCQAHRCTVPNCTAKRGAGADAEACYKHRCAIPACPYPVLDPALPFASLHCASHACRAKGCPALRASADTDFCSLHACPTPGCRSPARAAGAHCVRHACEVFTCKRERLGELARVNVRLSGGGQHPERCAEHSYARERRRVTLAGAGRGTGIATGVGGLDVEWLRERFGVPDEEMWEEQRRKAKRWSDDLEGVRSREEEREREREEELRRKRAELRELRSEMRQRGF